MTLDNSVASNMSKVFLSSSNDENNQKWYIRDLGSDVFCIEPVINQKRALDFVWGNASNGNASLDI